MALREDGRGRLVGRVDPADLAEWSLELLTKQGELDAGRRRLKEIDDRLAAPDVGPARAEHTAATVDRTTTADAASTADGLFTAARDEATRYENTELVTAGAELDDAVLAVSRKLAELLKEASTSAAITATVDGLALRERYRTATAATVPVWNHDTVPFPTAPDDVVDPELALPLVGEEQYLRLLDVLGRLDDRVDAVADLVASESVHQLVTGNPTRAGGSLAVVAQGRVPDDFDVIRTPRPGHDVVHRVLVLLDPQRAPAWTVARPGPAARLDPATEAWAAGLLPDPATAGVRVRFLSTDDDGAEVAPPVDLVLSELGLDALGWVRAAADPAELAHRITVAVGTSPGRPTWDDTVPPASAALSLADLVAAARAVGRVLALARGLEPSDLAHPSAAGAGDVPAAALDAVADRIGAAERWTAELADTLLDLAAGSGPSGPLEMALRVALLDATGAGVAEAVPPPDADPSDPELLPSLARAAAARLRGRGGAPRPAAAAAVSAWARARAETLAGMRLPLALGLPLPPALTATDLAVNGTRPDGATPDAVRTWLLDHARVRTPVSAALAAYDLAEALGAAEHWRPRVTQLPARGADDVWVGSVPEPAPGRIALVVQPGYPAAVPATVAGLVLDTWTQAVPGTEHPTAVAMHYDQPDAAPPQSLLVAVHPDPDPAERWDLDTLLDVVTSTLAFARDRAVAAELRSPSGVEVRDG